MTNPTKLRLVGFVHPIGFGHSFLTPVFVGNNEFWVQEISDDDKILSFVRTRLSGYIFTPNTSITLQSGSPALFAFYTGGASVMSGDRETLSSRLADWSRSMTLSEGVVDSLIDFTGNSEFLLRKDKSTNLGRRGTLHSHAPTVESSSLPDLVVRQMTLIDESLRSAALMAEFTAAATANFTSGFNSILAAQQELLSSLLTVGSPNHQNPVDGESAVALVKSAVAAANNAYESVHRAAKRAAEIAEANFESATRSDELAGKKASARKKAVGE